MTNRNVSPQQSKYKVMNKDQWYNVLEFSRTVNTDLSNYDEDGACKCDAFFSSSLIRCFWVKQLLICLWFQGQWCWMSLWSGIKPELHYSASRRWIQAHQMMAYLSRTASTCPTSLPRDSYSVTLKGTGTEESQGKRGNIFLMYWICCSSSIASVVWIFLEENGLFVISFPFLFLSKFYFVYSVLKRK